MERVYHNWLVLIVHSHAENQAPWGVVSPRHFFLEQGICPLFVLFDSPPTVAKKEKGVFRGHPEPRQRALPSALPKTVGERVGSGRLGTALQGDASVPTPLHTTPAPTRGKNGFLFAFCRKRGAGGWH